MTSSQYEIVYYLHEVVEGRLRPDSSSPTGYALLTGVDGSTVKGTSESVGGTGVVIGMEGTTSLVITSHHVVEFPETLTLEVASPLLQGDKLVVGRGRRVSQSTVVGRPGESQTLATVVAFSREADLALLRADLRRLGPYVAPLPHQLGETGALRAGDGVYVLGAPEGKFQVSWGVATPEGPTLLRLDTSTPSGYSGGAVLATNRETGAMELVGVVRGTAGTSENVWQFDESVIPGMRLSEADPSRVVAGTVRSRAFGVTYCTPVGLVRTFLETAMEEAKRTRAVSPLDVDDKGR